MNNVWKIASLSALIIVLVGGGIYFFYTKNTSAPVIQMEGGVKSSASSTGSGENSLTTSGSENVDTTSTEVGKPIPYLNPQVVPHVFDQSMIAWKKLSDKKLIKSITVDKSSEYYTKQGVTYIDVYDIGEIKVDPYKGDTLAFAIDADKNHGIKNEYGNYTFYIADKNGNPIAWYGSSQMFLYCMIQYPPYFCDENAPFIKMLGLKNSLRNPDQDLNGKLLLQLLPYFGVGEDYGKKGGYAIKSSHKLHLGIDNVPYQNVDKNYIGVENYKFIKTKEDPSDYGTLLVKDGTVMSTRLYALAPFGVAYEIEPIPDFLKDDSKMFTPGSQYLNVNWFKPKNGVDFGQTYYNFDDDVIFQTRECFESITQIQFENAFVQTGSTPLGDPVYELGGEVGDKVYACLYGYSRYNSGLDAEAKRIESIKKLSRDHEIFFWRSPITVSGGKSEIVPFLSVEMSNRIQDANVAEHFDD